ncbi:MAG: S1C family serine protease [Clostridia bacterium]
MSEFNNYQWYQDDFEKNKTNEGAVLSGESQSYYTENRKPKKKKFSLNYFTVAIISAVIGGLIFGTTFAFVSPMINKSVSSDTPKTALYPDEDSNDTIQKEEGDISNSNDTKSVLPLEPKTIIKDNEKKELSVVDIAKKAGPTVVGIINKVQTRGFISGSIEQGSGSGIIISEDGYIVTNNHVIEGAEEVTVTLNTGNKYEAKLIGRDAKTDIAVIKIEAKDLHFAELGESSKLEVGELAVAIGNPLGQEFAGSVTTGVISALNRTIVVEDKSLNLIQTDAAINPGNSGGALVNSYGEVIGINTVKMAASGVEGLGFAIPIDEAKPIINELMAHGYVTGRPLIGIGGRDITNEISRLYDLPVGIYVVQVTPFSGAETAGIKEGDVVIKVNGRAITTMEELNHEKDKFKAGDTIEIVVVRQGETKTVKVKLTEEKN